MNLLFDPNCREVIKFMEFVKDPVLTRYVEVAHDMTERFKLEHSVGCKRCEEYGLVNIETEQSK